MLAVCLAGACASEFPASSYPDPNVEILSRADGKKLYACDSRPDPPRGTLFSPSIEQISLAESALRELKSSENCDFPFSMNEKSRRQYVGIRGFSGRFLYVNGLPDEQVLRSLCIEQLDHCVSHLGPNFWGALFDLSAGRFVKIYFNGGYGPGSACRPAA